MSYYFYLIIAVCLGIGELFSMEFSLACLAGGSLGAALASYLGFNLWIQVIAFILVAGASWLGIRPIALKHLYGKNSDLKNPAEALLGKEAIVDEKINPSTKEGRVSIGAESWQATANQEIAKGTICIVEKLEGVTLTVRPK